MSGLLDEIKRQQRHMYAKGLKDGTAICLRLLMGDRVHGAEPCPQPIPDDVREWASAALLRVEATDI